MTRREVVKVIRDVITGNHAHTHVMVGKKDGRWVVDTNLNRYSNIFDMDWWDQFSYQTSKILTIKEVGRLLSELEMYSFYESESC